MSCMAYDWPAGVCWSCVRTKVKLESSPCSITVYQFKFKSMYVDRSQQIIDTNKKPAFEINLQCSINTHSLQSVKDNIQFHTQCS